MKTNDEKQKSNQKLKSKFKNIKPLHIISVALIIGLIICLALFFTRDKAEEKPVEIINKVETTNDGTKTDTIKEPIDESKTEEQIENQNEEYDPTKDTERLPTGKEPEKYIAAKLASLMTDVVNATTFSANDVKQMPTYLESILSETPVKSSIELGNITDKMNELLVEQGRRPITLTPVILASAIDDAEVRSAEDRFKAFSIQEADNHSYKAKLQLIKAIVPPGVGDGPSDLTNITKGVLDEYKQEGTLDDHTYKDIENITLKATSDGWAIQFDRIDWFMPQSK